MDRINHVEFGRRMQDLRRGQQGAARYVRRCAGSGDAREADDYRARVRF
ncbi:hypothetical protein VSR68_17705 [Paraburkholderia phymatum]